MDRFSFRSLPLGRARPPALAPAPAPDAIEIFPLTIASGVSAGERSGGELQALLDGDYSTVEHVDNELRWQAIGACPVPFRGSVMRVRSIIFEHQPPTTSFPLNTRVARGRSCSSNCWARASSPRSRPSAATTRSRPRAARCARRSTRSRSCTTFSAARSGQTSGPRPTVPVALGFCVGEF